MSVRKPVPLVLAVIVLFAACGACLALSLRATQGHFTYALDDAYIHMAMAKSLVQAGNWGVSPERFASSSSSPVWTLLVAAVFALVGIRDTVPLALNLAAAVLLLWCLDAVLAPVLAGEARWATLLAVAFLMPVPALVFGGQEHILHGCVTLALSVLCAREIASDSPSVRVPRSIIALAGVLPLVRYEGLFLIVVLAALFVLRGRLAAAFAVVAAAATSTFAFGLYSRTHGAFWLPNSVLVKGARPDLTTLRGLYEGLGGRSMSELAHAPHLAAIVFGLTVVLGWELVAGRPWSQRATLATIASATTLLHLQFANRGWFFRYEAYLVCLGVVPLLLALPEIVSFARALPRSTPAGVVMVLTVGAIASPLFLRGATSLHLVPRATQNIYQQQVQVALFLKESYRGQGVAANDIGAINYLADVRCLDLWGLADTEVAEARLRGRYDTSVIRSLVKAHGVRLAVVYEDWYEEFGGLPPEWVLVGRWTIPDNVVASRPTVSFLATDPGEVDSLTANLRRFSPRLPAGVKDFGALTPAAAAAQGLTSPGPTQRPVGTP
jgi:hypothetical protein